VDIIIVFGLSLAFDKRQKYHPQDSGKSLDKEAVLRPVSFIGFSALVS